MPKPRISTFATAFVRAVTASASCTAGSRSRSGTSPSGTSANSATSGSARNVSDDAQAEREEGGEAALRALAVS